MKFKQTTAFFLVFAMLLTLLPSSVFATEAVQESNPETNEAAQTEEIAALLHPSLDEQTIRERGHIERLHAEEGENLNSLVYRNQDGTKTMYLFDQPVKYRDAQGQTHDISLEIADTDDSSYPFRTQANSAVTEFPALLPDGILLSGNGVNLRMAAQLPSSSTALNHHARRVDANTIAYTYDAKTTIEYKLTYTGFKEDIVVSEYTGQTEYPFILYTNGMNLTNIDGGYYLTDETGAIGAVIGDIIVFTADERNNTFGTMQVTTIKPGQVYGLTIVLDADYLADPNTVYPIRIDPTVQLVYTDAAPNVIEEKTIQSNGTTNGSNSTTAVGYSSYGINRSIMKFPGLDFSEVEGVTVTSAVATLRDLMCESEELTVTCYPFTGSIWTESTAQWSNLSQSWGDALSSKVISYDSGRQQESAHRYRFDITELAQKWVDGYADPARGIIFRADSSVESGPTIIYKTFATSERSGYRPTFEITYRDVMSLEGELDVDKGSSITLSASSVLGQEDGLTWTSSVESVATVDQSGKVSGIALGTTVITASYVDEDGNPISASCTVYVTVPDGVYYIRRTGSTMCLANDDASINSVSTHVESKNTSTVTDPTQFWQITHISAGWYAIRPVDRILAVLTADSSGKPVVTDLAENATIHLSNRWKIIQESTGYVFLHKGLSTKALTAAGLTEGANVTFAAKTSSNNCHWVLELATGLFLRDTTTQRAIHTSPEVKIAFGQSYTLADLGLKVEYYGTPTHSSWGANSTSNYNIASVDTNGTVTPNYGGISTITYTIILDEIGFSVSYTLISILPLSGYELDYKPDLWNSNEVIRLGTRCYAYALNIQVHPGTNKPWNIQPGEKSGIENVICLPNNIENYVQLDASTMGFMFSRIDKDAVCDPYCYKVALVIDANKDYHWYRQNPDGTWSHKLSDGIVSNVDSENNEIYDPSIACKDYTDSIGFNYDYSITYFQIEPLNYLYSETNNVLSVTPNSISMFNVQSISELKSSSCFDITIADVVLLLDEPNCIPNNEQ